MADRYYFDDQERYPVYYPTRATEGSIRNVELPDGFLERFNKAAAEWDAVQAICSELDDEAATRYHNYMKEHGCKKMIENWGGARRRCNYLPDDDGTCPNERNHVA